VSIAIYEGDFEGWQCCLQLVPRKSARSDAFAVGFVEVADMPWYVLHPHERQSGRGGSDEVADRMADCLGTD